MTKEKTKKGAASIYAVVFVTLLLGIVTVSFVRLILRESTDTTNSELSSSSRDAALAGVEDAKRAIDANYSGPVPMNDCGYVKAAVWNSYDPSSPDASPEVKIQETTSADSDSKTEQAYTCVTIDPDVLEYKGSLDSSTPVAIIPLKTESTSPTKVEFSWQLNNNGASTIKYPNKDAFQNKDAQSSTSGDLIAPVISFQYIQMNDTSDPVGDYDPYNSNTSTFFLTPAGSGSGTTISLARSDSTNNKTNVECTTGNDYVCQVTATLPSSASGSANKYLVISLPYGVASTGSQTDFQVRMLDNSGNPIPFHGVQYLVDSTGRANDLYTRLEVRLNTVDPNFPYPQFALQTAGNLEKYFWVTNNCQKIDNGVVQQPRCNDSGEL